MQSSENSSKQKTYQSDGGRIVANRKTVSPMEGEKFKAVKPLVQSRDNNSKQENSLSNRGRKSKHGNPQFDRGKKS